MNKTNMAESHVVALEDWLRMRDPEVAELESRIRISYAAESLITRSVRVSWVGDRRCQNTG